MKSTNARLRRWKLELEEFDYKVNHMKEKEIKLFTLFLNNHLVQEILELADGVIETQIEMVTKIQKSHRQSISKR